MTKKIYLVSLDNGLSYDDNQVEPIMAFTTKQKAQKYMDNNSLAQTYKDIFHYTIPEWAHPYYAMQEIELQ